MDRYDLLRSIYVGIHDVFDASIKGMSQALKEFGITPAQLGVLVNIPEQGATMPELIPKQGVTMSELIQRVGCAPSNMTSIIRRMERDGFVYTGRNPDDQREALVYLTPVGKDLLHKIRPAYNEFLERSYGHLSTAEQMMLSELLGKVRSNSRTPD